MTSPTSLRTSLDEFVVSKTDHAYLEAHVKEYYESSKQKESEQRIETLQAEHTDMLVYNTKLIRENVVLENEVQDLR